MCSSIDNALKEKHKQNNELNNNINDNDKESYYILPNVIPDIFFI